MEYLTKCWALQSKYYSVKESRLSYMFLNLRYTESYRAYHNWNHIEDMLRKLDTLVTYTK